jgi:O-antigen/teichoic acid export membrane protein
LKDSSNKQIAKNTLFLYSRMILTLGVSLYTSRVVLNTLGVEDFGIYNLVGGIVVLFSFINASMTSATQRFLNYEMGKEDDNGVHKVFCISVNVYLLILILIVVLAETIGLWFLNTKLNIPLNRMAAANIVYQFSILTFAVNILKVPYNASIIAYEKMAFYAWTSIIEVFLKLFIVFALVYLSSDKLVLYAVLTFSVSVVMFLMYLKFCVKTFATCRYKYIYDKELIQELLGFSGWSMFGSVSVIASNQGIAMILNIFLGVTINAAMGIANQVNTALYGFVSNFRIAFQPQLIKTYAAGDIETHKKLLFQTSKFSYFLLLILAVPVLLNTSYILSIWLNTVPHYAVIFTQLTIILSLIEALSGPFWMSVSATGKIKIYQIIVSGILLLNLPLAYVFLNNSLSPEYVLLGKLGIGVILFFFRILYAGSFLQFTFIEVLRNLLWQILVVSLFISGTLFLLKDIIIIYDSVVLNTITLTIISMCLSVIFVFYFGISKVERLLITNFIINKIKYI